MEANHTGGNASIHTTCECSDRYIALIIADSGISIHAAREGGDALMPDNGAVKCLFQSTPPVKAATFRTARACQCRAISIHAAREGGDVKINFAFMSATISIHAAREGGDVVARFVEAEFRISIHAAREGGDAHGRTLSQASPIFQSTPPVKAATIMTGYTLAAEKFQSTPPVKAATCAPVTAAVTPLFQSTPPVKAATVRVLPVPPRGAISIHAAREGGDWGWHMTLTLKNNFNPRRP